MITRSTINTVLTTVSNKFELFVIKSVENPNDISNILLYTIPKNIISNITNPIREYDNYETEILSILETVAPAVSVSITDEFKFESFCCAFYYILYKCFQKYL